MSHTFKISISILAFNLGDFILLSNFKITLLKNQTFQEMTLLKRVNDTRTRS